MDDSDKHSFPTRLRAALRAARRCIRGKRTRVQPLSLSPAAVGRSATTEVMPVSPLSPCQETDAHDLLPSPLHALPASLLLTAAQAAGAARGKEHARDALLAAMPRMGVRLVQRLNAQRRFYSEGPVIGRGSFGTVSRATNTQTGATVAVKCIPFEKLQSEDVRARIVEEINVLKMVKHSCITQLLDVYMSDTGVHMVMEMASNNGIDFLNVGVHEEKVLFRLFWQIASAVAHCHSRNICHRDIKPENILIYQDGNAKLADFGLAGVMNRDSLSSLKCGTAGYTAPEVFSQAIYNAIKSDIFSLGILLFAIYMKRLPYPTDSKRNARDAIQTGKVLFNAGVPDTFKDFFFCLTHWDPHVRPTTRDLKRHPFWLDRCERMGLSPNGC